MLRTPERDAHLHVYGEGAGEIQDYRDLRDCLCHDRADRDMYAAKKRELAKEQWLDMNDYTRAKDDVVVLVLAHARAWRAGRRAQDDRGRTCASLPPPVPRARATRFTGRSRKS
ncbi:GrpB family protein [Streptomyces atratus]